MKREIRAGDAITTFNNVKQMMVGFGARKSVLDGFDVLVDLTSASQSQQSLISYGSSKLQNSIIGLRNRMDPHSEGARDATTWALQSIKALTNMLTDSSQISAQGMMDTARNMSFSMVQSGREGARQFIGQTAQIVSGITNIVGNIFGDSDSIVNPSAGNMVDVAAKSALGVMDNAQKQANTLLGNVQQQATNLVENTLSGVQEVQSTARDLAVCMLGEQEGNAVANEIMGDAPPSSFSGNLDQALSSVSDSVGKSIETASSIADAVPNAAANSLQMVADVAKNIIDNANEVESTIVKEANDIKEKVKEKAQEEFPDDKDVADQINQQIDDKVDDTSESLENGSNNLLNNQMESSEDDGKDSIEQANEELDEVDDEVNETSDEFDPEEPNEDEYDDSLDGDNYPEGTEPEPPEDIPSEDHQPDANPNSSSTPSGNNDNIANDNTKVGEASQKSITLGWKSVEPEITTGLIGMMHDGDQVLFNPYGRKDPGWTTYSFRPKDRDATWPWISIVPASLRALDSMDTMLNNIPYVVIKEYFFKNTASTMINFVQKIMAQVKEATKSPNDESPAGANGESDNVDLSTEKDSKGKDDAQPTGNTLMDKIKNAFEKVPLKMQVIDIPYILYCGLRRKLYGNTYIFPYLVSEDGSSIINQANNTSEWAGEGNSIMNMIKGAISNVAEAVGGLALGLSGSNGTVAKLFPAPTWGGPGDDKIQFQFDLMLINDNIVTARNNYMCVNSIIHNNRSMQKAILAFPGALYELWLPTGQRHLMCTCDLKLYPLGLNRKVPKGFFSESSQSGADFNIGTVVGDAGVSGGDFQKHNDEIEVIPDGYKLSCNFQSCLANNLNTSVFQYYVKMTGYEDDKGNPTYTSGNEMKDDVFSRMEDAVKPYVQDAARKLASPNTEDKSNGEPNEKQETPKTPAPTPNDRNVLQTRLFARAINDLVDYVEPQTDNVGYEIDDSKEKERFDESTYNKKIGKLQTQFGDYALNADSVVMTIRKASGLIRETRNFLSKLYNAQDNNLWYKPFEKEEYYTTLKADYRQILKKRYQQRFKELQESKKEIDKNQDELDKINEALERTIQIDDRNQLLDKKVQVNKSLNLAMNKRDVEVDDLLQIDTDLIQAAFDEHDDTISVKKNRITTRIFQQEWNEKIMNSYEKDKIQYMTSKEKTQYFNDKIRELKKYDVHQVLNHKDWFFRVTVLDFIVSEMNRLVLWFKRCSFDDFETIYRIIRKLNLLQLDVDQVFGQDDFIVNRTNLFYISDDDMRKFTKIDGMLTGNTLYELFKNQVEMQMIQDDSKESGSDEPIKPEEKKELVQEQTSEQLISEKRRIRQDIITRVWGSESELTRLAYELISKNETNKLVAKINGVDEEFEGGLKQLKDEIISLKLNKNDDERLMNLLGVFSSQVSAKKEEMIMYEMGIINDLAQKKQDQLDTQVNINVIPQADSTDTTLN